MEGPVADSLCITASIQSECRRAQSADALRGDVVATVCICAHNEASVLADAVESVMAQRVSADCYEVLVVDSASDDTMPGVMRSLQAKWGKRLRCVREDQPGLSRARNRGMEEARGAIVAFIDADAVTEPNWLAGVLEVFESDEKVGAVGGRISVQWDHQQPRWWRRELDEVFNFYQPGAAAMRLSYPRYPYGTNLAVRREAAMAVGGFASSLGRRGRMLIAGEDGELCLRLERAGWTVMFTPDAMVRHRTNAARLSRRYILKRAFRHGRSQRAIERMHGFESKLYPSLWRLLAMVCGRIVTLRCGLPFLKFAMFRLGYRWGLGAWALGTGPWGGERGVRKSHEVNKSKSQQVAVGARCECAAPGSNAQGRRPKAQRPRPLSP